MEYIALRELTSAVLATAIDDRDIDFVLSCELDLWCDVLSLDPNLFRERFLNIVKQDLEEFRRK